MKKIVSLFIAFCLLFSLVYVGASADSMADTMYDLAEMYYYGSGAEQDYGKALEWYRKAADGGKVAAMNDIGFMYQMGYGVEQSYSLALEWYLKAAELGSALAMCNIGFLYDIGCGVPQSYSMALEWYLKAVEGGESQAMCNIGVLYEYGQGVPQSYSKALEWYQQAANAGNMNAVNAIDNLYNSGVIGVNENVETPESEVSEIVIVEEADIPEIPSIVVPELGSEVSDEATENGNARALYNLGLLYEQGQGVPQNISMALKWYRKAADAGYADAIEAVERLSK